MPDDPQENGTPVASESTLTQEVTPQAAPETTTEVSPETQETSTETPAINTVGQALDAFQKNKEEVQAGGYVKVPITPAKVSRDFTGLPDDMVPLFKNMSNQAFNTLKPMFLEHLKLKEDHNKLKTDYENSSKQSFYESEKGYQVTPEYENLAVNANSLDREINHWQQQLVAIRKGESWQPLVRDANGNVVRGEPVEASPEGEAIVLNAITQGYILKTDVVNKLENIKSNFITSHKTFMGNFQKVIDDAFKGADKSVLEKATATKLPLFPSHTHNNPLVRGLATALAVIEGMGMLLEEQKSAVTTEKIKTRTLTNAGPSTSTLGAPGAKKGETVGAAIDEFTKAKALGIA